jgi:hypothetical protein
MAHHTTTWGLWSGHSWRWRGFVGVQYRQFCLFTEPLRENIASSLTMRNLPRSACVCTLRWQQRTRNTLCAAVNSWTICSLYGWKCKSWCKIRRTLLSDKFKRWECRPPDRRGLLSKAILTHWIFSGDQTVFQRVWALTRADPVSRHWPIIFLEGAAPRCWSSPNFRQNSRCTDMIDLLNTNCSTQNMRCCTDQHSIVHWIQGHTEPNHRC